MTDIPQPEGCCDIGGDLLHADLDAAALDLAAAGFAALWRGRPVPPAELVPHHPGAAAEVLDALATSGRAELDGNGHLIGIHGLTLRATRHHFEHAGRAHRTWCAFDSVGIPAALRLDAVAYSDCPACHRTLKVTILGGIPDRGHRALWLPAPTGGHLMNDFCASADLYCSSDHLHQRVDTSLLAGTVAELQDAVDLGCETWADVAGIDVTGLAL